MDSQRSITSWIIATLSAVVFFATTLLGWFLPNAHYFLIFSGALIAICMILRRMQNERTVQIANALLPTCAIICILSLSSALYYSFNRFAGESNKRLCDFTEAAIGECVNNQIDKSGLLTQQFYVYSIKSKDKVPRDIKIQLIDINPQSPLSLGSSYYVALSNRELFHRNTKVLPPNVKQTILGYYHYINAEWDEAFRLLNQAFEGGNGVAAYLLYLMYKNNCGIKKSETVDLTIHFLKESAKLGYRKAQYEYGIVMIKSDEPAEIIQGVDYLKEASLLSSFRTSSIFEAVDKSIDALQEYYLNTGQYREAYNFSNLLIKHNKNDKYLYERHLENCIINKRFKEANKIISQGKRLNKSMPTYAAYCYIADARMYIQGWGGHSVDLSQAERLLRIASDSLDSNSARKELSNLYKQNSIEEDALFWGRLYELNFHKKIER